MEILTHATHVNGWEPAVYMSCMSQNFHFVSRTEFIRSKLSNFSAHVSGVSVGSRTTTVNNTPLHRRPASRASRDGREAVHR